jgi:threonine-phosphate decarboxylase
MTDYVHGGEIYNKEVLHDFSVNTNPLGLPEKVKKMLTTSIEQFSLYPDPKCSSLKEAIGKKVNISKEYITCGNGASDLIFRLCIAKKPRLCLLLAPTFSEYEKALKAVGSEIIYYNLIQENNFNVEEDILDHIKNIDMMFLCNPNNPVGNLIDNTILRKIVKKCEMENVLLVMDECFLDFTKVEDCHGQGERPYLGEEDKDSNSLIEEVLHNKSIFVLRAFTKFYAMAGLRLGYGFCSDIELLNRMDLAGPSWSVSVPAQLAGAVACEEIEYEERTKAIIEKERRYLVDELQKLGIKVFKPRANYIFFKETSSLYEKLLQRGILIRQCGNYRQLSKEFYRIAVKSRKENEIFIKNLEECLHLQGYKELIDT